MKPEQQLIAIAEACGWKETEAWLDGRRCFERADSNAGWDFDSLPDYLDDLNAMHEAEKTLTDKAHEEFRLNLYDVIGDDSRLIVSSAAAQRAEAFLRTIGKWKESKP